MHVGLLAAALVTAAARDAGAYTVCVKRSGQLVARDACRRRERPFDPAAAGFVGPAGPSGPTGAAGPPGAPERHPYRVVDAAGKTFGTLIGYDTYRAQVVTTLPGIDHPVQFVVEYGAISNEGQTTVRYQQPNCTGTPFVAGSFGLVPPVVVIGSMGYFATAAPGLVALSSSESAKTGTACPPNTTATGRGTCCVNSLSEGTAAPAAAVPMASLGITLPLVVEP